MSDTTTTKEDMGTLGDLVPLLAKKVADSQEAADALEKAAAELQHEVEEARQEAPSRLAALQDALPSLVVQIEGEEKSLKDADTALLGAWHEAEAAFTRTGEAVAKQADDVVTHSHDLRAALAEAGTKVDQAQALGEAALARLAHDTQEAEQRLQAALHALEAEVEHLKQSTEAAHEALTNAARDLLAVLTEAAGHADTALHEALEDMGARTSAHKDAAESLYSALAEQLMEKVDGADGEIQHAVTTPLHEAEAHLHGDLEKLGATAGAAEKLLQEHGQALEHALEQVKAEAGVVPAGIEEIHEAASRLGV